MSATVSINGIPVEADGFVWDGCHKIYLIDSPLSREGLLGCGWTEGDLRPLSELAHAWENSCGLRFISSGDLNRSYVAQGDEGTVSVIVS